MTYKETNWKKDYSQLYLSYLSKLKKDGGLDKLLQLQKTTKINDDNNQTTKVETLIKDTIYSVLHSKQLNTRR